MTTVTRSIHFVFEGRLKRAVRGPRPAPAPAVPSGRVPRVARLMALAIKFERLLNEGLVESQTELAELAHVTQPRMTQIMNLLHLAPDIQEAILFLPLVEEGPDPVTERDLRELVGEPDWGVQRRIWNSLCASTGIDRLKIQKNFGGVLAAWNT